MTKQTKRKGKIKMQTYEVNQEVSFQGEQYKVVELLSEGTLVHLKKVEAPFNTMVVPAYKIGDTYKHNLEELERGKDVGNETLPPYEENKPDLLYRPDDRITLLVETSPEVQAVLDEFKKEEE